MISKVIGAIFSVITGIMNLRKWKRENKKTVIAPDNKRLRESFVKRMQLRIRNRKKQPAEQGKG